MKKVLSVILSVLLLTACGGTQPGTDTPEREEYKYTGPTVNFPITEEQAKEIHKITDREYELLDYNSWDDNHRVMLFSDESGNGTPTILVDICGEENKPIEFMATTIHYSMGVNDTINQQAADEFNEKAKEQLDDILRNYYGYSDLVSDAWTGYNAFLERAEKFEGVRIIFVQHYGNTLAKITATREDMSSPYMLKQISFSTEEWTQQAEISSANALKAVEGYTVFDSVKEIKNVKTDKAFAGEAEFELTDFEYSETMPQELASGAYKNVPMGKDGYISATLSDGKTGMKCFVSPDVSCDSGKHIYQFAVIPAEQPVVAVLGAIK